MVAPMQPGERRLSAASVAAMGFALACMAAALPWELFQRLPFLPLTVVRLASLLVLVLGLTLLIRSRSGLPGWRTGLEGPAALLGAVCALTLLWSLDRASSLHVLLTYGGYAAVAYVVGICLADGVSMRRMMGVYVFSAFGVALLTLACWAEWIYPAYWRPTEFPWSGRLIELYRQGAEMRIVAASSDLNQGALYLLVALAFSLFAFEGRRRSILAAIFLRSVQALLVVGMVLAQSRSAMLGATCLVAAYAYVSLRPHFGKRMLVSGFVLGLGFIAIFGWRMLRGLFLRDDHAVSARMDAFNAGVELLPEYWLQGVGIGASDTAIAMLGAGPHVGGQTIHNVPFQFLLETGVLGFAAFVWLVGLCGVRLVRVCRERPETTGAHVAAALAAAGFAVLFMGLFQPFSVLPLYPLILGLTAGLIRPVSRESQPSAFRVTVSPTLTGLAFSVVTVLVIVNAVLFQNLSQRSERYGDILTRAARAETYGHWDRAGALYRAALETADGRNNDMPLAGFPMARAPFAHELAVLFDYPAIHDNMNLGRDHLDARSAALTGAGRVLLARGDAAEARAAFTEALQYEPNFASAAFYRAETDWRSGRYLDGVAGYERAAELAELPANWRFNSFVKRLERRLAGLRNRNSAVEALERAYLLRRLGRWPEAVAESGMVVEQWPDYADAHFNLGVDALLRDELDEAEARFEEACQLAPRHYAACSALEDTKFRDGRSAP